KLTNSNENTPYHSGLEYDNILFTNINLSVNSPAPQNEPSVRISRVNPNIVVAAWRDFRLGWDPNPVRRIGYTYSTNGGQTWAVSQLLPDPNPTYVSQSDPVLTSDNAGNFYLSSTSRKPVAGYNRDQIVYKSTNNGQTFSFLSVAIAGTGGGGEDKEWMFCDPVTSNPTYNNIFMTSTNTNNGAIRFAKSTNGGINWTAPVTFTTGGSGSNICSGTGGQIYIVWEQAGVRFDRSTDGGLTFGTDFQLSNVTSTQGFPFICSDYSTRPSRGNVYVIWDDSRGGSSDIYFQRSTNAGVNWLSTPVRVNDVTTNIQRWPAIQCDTNGYLYVIYFDTRLGTTQFNSWIAYSTDQGTTWVNNRLSDVSFPATAVGTDARYGDYIGIDAFAGRVIPVWTDDRAGTPNQEIYTANLAGLIGIQTITDVIPEKFKLYQNYPNPFNPSTKIKFDVSEPSFVKVTVYDALGKEVSSPVNEDLQAGSYEFNFNAFALSSGIYFYEINARQDGSATGNFIDVKKMMFVK
ncbi:MAG TPA: T9SS type A sorting domain-containing protein, partial [Ignavibacteria bacterium]|nr:T9SS type A sorting domain-containing protein [Ignavibacteria bacterium]